MGSHTEKTYVISDIHGCYDEFEQLLASIPYMPGIDRLIFLGDYVDRGPRSKDVLEKMVHLCSDEHAVAIRGNHDEMFLDFINGEDPSVFLYNGGLHTILSYCGSNWFNEIDFLDGLSKAREYILKHFRSHVAFLRSLPLYYETKDHIFVHAGINPFYNNWKMQPFDDFIWIRDPFILNPTRVKKTVVFGHTPTIDIHGSGDIWFGGDKIGIDGGCVFGGQLNCLEISVISYKTYSVPSTQ